MKFFYFKIVLALWVLLPLVYLVQGNEVKEQKLEVFANEAEDTQFNIDHVQDFAKGKGKSKGSKGKSKGKGKGKNPSTDPTLTPPPTPAPETPGPTLAKGKGKSKDAKGKGKGKSNGNSNEAKGKGKSKSKGKGKGKSAAKIAPLSVDFVVDQQISGISFQEFMDDFEASTQAIKATILSTMGITGDNAFKQFLVSDAAAEYKKRYNVAEANDKINLHYEVDIDKTMLYDTQSNFNFATMSGDLLRSVFNGNFLEELRANAETYDAKAVQHANGSQIVALSQGDFETEEETETKMSNTATADRKSVV